MRRRSADGSAPAPSPGSPAASRTRPGARRRRAPTGAQRDSSRTSNGGEWLVGGGRERLRQRNDRADHDGAGGVGEVAFQHGGSELGESAAPARGLGTRG